MTVTYTGEVATCRGFGCFLKLLFRWRGSIYKLVWPDLMIFLFLYYVFNLTYRFALNPSERKIFENLVQYCENFSDLIPLSFVLGFYVSIVMQRWWNQYTSIPWPDPIAVFVSSNIHGQDERGRVMRRTIMRYVCLCLTMIFTMNSPRVKKRFPTLEHFVEAGLLTENEKSIVSDLNIKFPPHSKHWLPIVWAASIVTRARKEGRIRDDFAVKTIIDELNKFRGQCGLLLSYDSISIPLVYTQIGCDWLYSCQNTKSTTNHSRSERLQKQTKQKAISWEILMKRRKHVLKHVQVVTLAVYSYFLTCIMGRQYLEIEDETSPLYKHANRIDMYFPVFTTLQFFFYMGWLKVAESLINPFGEDDDDFEVNWLVDRNLQVSYLIVDEMHHEHPELIKDQYWDEVFPSELPYTVASEQFRDGHPEPSTANIEIPKEESEYVPPSSLKDELINQNYDDAQSGIHFSAGPKRSLSRVSTRERMTSAGSTASMNTGSLASSLHRVGSVTSVLRRLFSREGQPASQSVVAVDGIAGGDGGVEGGGGGGPTTKLPVSASSASLHSKFLGGGSTRIADQVIEEVDEQSTVQSIRPPDQRPNVRTIFPSGPPLPSAPMAVPASLNTGHLNFPPLSSSAPASAAIPPPTSPTRSSITFTEILSVKSAPGYGNDNVSTVGSAGSKRGSVDNESSITIGPIGQLRDRDGDNVSIGGSSTDSVSEDEFSRLKASRDKERKERLIQRLARSISAQQAGMEDNEHLLMDLTSNSQTGLINPSPQSSLYRDANV